MSLATRLSMASEGFRGGEGGSGPGTVIVGQLVAHAASSPISVTVGQAGVTCEAAAQSVICIVEIP